MGKKLKFAVIALLGFSTACSSSKKSQKSSEPEPQPQPAEMIPRIKVMYGVRNPYPVTVDQAEKLMQEQQSNNPEQEQTPESAQNPSATE